MKPRVAFQVPNTLTGRGEFERRHHVREHGRLLAGGDRAEGRRASNELLEARQQLANLVTYMDGKTGAEELISKVLHDPELAASGSPRRPRPAKARTAAGGEPDKGE